MKISRMARRCLVSRLTLDNRLSFIHYQGMPSLPPAASAESRASSWFGVLPAVCAVHCLAMPILASTLPFFAATHSWEAGLLAVSALLAVITLATSWRLHGRWVVWVIASLGFAVWIAALAGWLAPLPESLMSPLGGVLVAGSLFWSGHLRHKVVCGACACPVHPG